MEICRIDMQEHMKTIHVLELRQLEFEKALLAIHYSRMTKPADVQREMKVRYQINTRIIEFSIKT